MLGDCVEEENLTQQCED